MIELTDKPIDARTVFERLSREAAGSVALHYAVVKPTAEGKKTGGILFGADGDVDAEMRAIEADMRDRFDVADVLLVRRLGELRVGDIISVAAVSAPGREAAFGACANAVERFKKMRCLKKRELFE